MTDKAFYQAAAAEVANGQLDDALWIKVNAELPEATDVVKQAKYIQLRAQEVSGAAKKNAVVGWWRRRALWQKALMVLFVVWLFAVLTIH